MAQTVTIDIPTGFSVPGGLTVPGFFIPAGKVNYAFAHGLVGFVVAIAKEFVAPMEYVDKFRAQVIQYMESHVLPEDKNYQFVPILNAPGTKTDTPPLTITPPKPFDPTQPISPTNPINPTNPLNPVNPTYPLINPSNPKKTFMGIDLTAIAQAIDALRATFQKSYDGLRNVGAFFTWLGKPHTLERLAAIGFGAALVIVGAVAFVGSFVDTGEVVKTAATVAKVAA